MGVREFASGLLYGQPEQRSSLTAYMDRWSWWGPMGPTPPGTLSYDGAQAHSAVYACTDLLVRLIAWQMPVYVDGKPVGPLVRPGLQSITENPHPEPQMSLEHWKAQVLESAILRGYACGPVTAMSERGYPAQILPEHPDLLGWSDKEGRWEYTLDGRPARLWQEGGDLWLAPALRVTPGQPVGRGVLWHAMRQVQLGLGAGKFGLDFFEAGGAPTSHMRLTDQPNLTSEQAETLSARFLEKTRNRKPLVTGSNVELNTIAVSADESQFLQTMVANKADVCSFFGVPPEAIGSSSGDSMTYANVEGRNLSLLTNTVGAWMVWLERLMSSLLPGRQAVTLDPEALLRTSVPTLFATAQVGFKSGILTRDEARVLVGYEPLGESEPGDSPDDEPMDDEDDPAEPVEQVVGNG
jgi:phage portal protein BeeE